MSTDDGGSAFPMPHTIAGANDYAFKPGCPGMSLRDYFAAKAMQSHLWRDKWKNPFTEGDLACLAACAYEAADAMLAERNRSLEPPT